MKKQRGFTLVEALLIITLVLATAFVSWYVFTKSNAKDSQNSSSASSTKTDTKATSTPSDTKTTTLTSLNKKFSIDIPDGWVVTNDTQQDYAHAIGLSNMTYKPGTAAQIVNELGHRGEGVTTSSFIIQFGNSSDLNGYFSASTKQGSIKTSAGLEGEKYLFTATGQADGVKGSMTYGYKFTSGDKTTVITYLKLPSDPDQLSVVENAVKTFKML